MFAVGDIVEIFAPQAGKKKFQVCICADAGAAHQFLYLNSDPSFAETIAFDCAKVPCLPPSKTGKTVFTFAYLPRYNDQQLKLYNAKKLGTLDSAVAQEVLTFAATAKTLNSKDRAIVTKGLTAIVANLTAPSAINPTGVKPAAPTPQP